MKLHELQQKRNDVARQMRGLNDSIGDNNWTDEDKTKYQEMRSVIKDLDFKIEVEEEQRKEDEREARSNAKDEGKEKRAKDAGLAYGDVHTKYLRSGFSGLNREEREFIKKESRALGEGTDSAGGYTVPTEFEDYIIETMKDYGGIANNCYVMTTSDGRTMTWATTDGTSDMGDFIGENTKAGEQDVVFGQIELGAKKLTSKTILVSNELLQDTGVNLQNFLGRRIASRIGRKEADAIVNGTGAGLQNKGLSKWVTGTTNVAAKGTVTWKDINNLIHSLDPAYRRSSAFKLAFNDSTLQHLELQEDNQGRPLWLPSIAGGTPATILGTPYFIDQAIANLGTAANKAVYAGAWDYFTLRRVRYMQLKRLTELYAESDQTGFLAFHRFDTLLEDTSAIKALTDIA